MGKILAQVILLISLVGSACSAKPFSELIQYVKDPDTEPIYPDPDQLYSEYIYGDCDNKANILYAKRQIEHAELKDMIIYSKWISMKALPSCIILRGTSFEEEFCQAPAFNFKICPARLTIIYKRATWRDYFFEWYTPSNFAENMNWDLFFYGPNKADW